MRDTSKLIEELISLPDYICREEKTKLLVTKKALTRIINDAKKEAIHDAAMILGETTKIETKNIIVIMDKYPNSWAVQEAILKLKLKVK